MVELAEGRLSGFNKLNCARRRALFFTMQCLSRYDRAEGARLPQWAYSSEKIGRFIQHAVIECELAVCVDWDSWKPTGYNLEHARARAFIPCWELIWADTGTEVVSDFANYCRGNYELRAPLHRENRLVLPCAQSGVELAPAIVRTLNRGTGLHCDFDEIRALLHGLPENERSRILCAVFASVGRAPVDDLHPLWKQHEWGRLYCSKPALVNMPTKSLGCLRSTEGLPLWCVDFSNFEIRIACKLTGQQLPAGDVYGFLAKPSGISRARVKAVVNPMLHGQTREQVWYARESRPDAKADRPLVENEMSRLLPTLISGLDRIRREDRILQQSGAQLFFSCMLAAMNRCEIERAGLPKHDGWIFAATESQAEAVRNVFESEAKRITEVHFPVTLEAISSANSLS